MNTETTLLSVFTPEGWENPYQPLAELRRVEPVYYSEAFGTHFLTRFADCQAVLVNPDFLVPDLDWFVRQEHDGRDHPAADFFYSSMLGANTVGHERLRRPVARAFSARRTAALLATVEKITEESLDRFADATSDGGAANFQELVGYPLPVAVVGDLIGVPREEQAQFRRLGEGASRLLEPIRTAEDWARADQAVVALREYFTDLLRRRRSRPAEDLASTLLEELGAGELPLTERELVDLLLLVFVAGFETTTGLLGLTVFALLTHPQQLAEVRRDPGLVPGAVEESLRWDAPVLMTERIADRALLVGGVAVPAGASVTTVLAAANRDPARHPDPDTFLVRRQDSKVLSFGAGAHYCLGAALARLEGAALVERLLARFPALTLAGPPVRRAAVNLRTFEDLPLATTG